MKEDSIRVVNPVQLIKEKEFVQSSSCSPQKKSHYQGKMIEQLSQQQDCQSQLSKLQKLKEILVEKAKKQDFSEKDDQSSKCDSNSSLEDRSVSTSGICFLESSGANSNCSLQYSTPIRMKSSSLSFQFAASSSNSNNTTISVEQQILIQNRFSEKIHTISSPSHDEQTIVRISNLRKHSENPIERDSIFSGFNQDEENEILDLQSTLDDLTNQLEQQNLC